MTRQVIEQLAQVSGVRDLEQLDLSLVTMIAEVLRPPRVSVWATVSDGEHERWYLRASQGQEDSEARSDPVTVRLDALPKRTQRPLLDRCVQTQRLVMDQRAATCVSCFPLFEDQGSHGVLEIQTAKALTRRELGLTGSLLRFYANFRWLVRDNERDLLTGLLNRKPFDELFDRTLQAVPGPGVQGQDDARSSDLPVQGWLALIDIDHFKRVNDQFGHLVGDEVLLLMARLMRNAFRLGDRAFRFGGEEFVLLLRDAPAHGAAATLERFRQRVQAHAFPQAGQLTVSIGYTGLQLDDTSHAAIERADRAVYVAKESGRNQLLCFEDLVRDGRLAPPDQVGSVDFF